MSGKRITVAMLRGLTPQPCSAEVAKFDQLFPRGAPLTLGNICKALRAGLDVEWLVVDDAAYDAARAPALAAYEEACASAQAAYEEAYAPAMLRGLTPAQSRSHRAYSPPALPPSEVRHWSSVLAAYDAARAPALLEALKRRFFEQATIDRGVDPTEGMNVDAIPD